MNHLAKAVLTVALFATGCGGSSSAFEGIYTVSTWTENDAGCDAEGPSVLANQNQTDFYIKLEKFFGESFLNVKFCDDVADCQTLSGDDDTINIGMFGFESGDDSSWSGGFLLGIRRPGRRLQRRLRSLHLVGRPRGHHTIRRTPHPCGWLSRG